MKRMKILMFNDLNEDDMKEILILGGVAFVVVVAIVFGGMYYYVL
jgi:hypothetical protein